MRPPPLAVHRMIEAMMADPELRTRFRDEPATLLERFAVPEEMRAALIEATSESLHRIGVHPSMQMKFFIAIGRPVLKPCSVRYYLDRV